MARSTIVLAAWLPAGLWMLLIFIASTDLLSGERTSRFLEPLLRWFLPGLEDATLHQAQVVVRKCGHVLEYAVLAALLLRALRRSRGVPADHWCARRAAWALGLAVLYAVSDEWHQSFVPSREGSLRDVLIDSAGAGLGLWLCHRWHLWRQARELRRRD